MKKIKMLAVLLVTVIGLTMIPEANVMTAEAAKPLTYSVKYIKDGDNGEWLFQADTNYYNEDAVGAELNALLYHLNEGDTVVVYNDVGDAPLLDLGSIHLSNLTIVGHQFSMVKFGSVDDFHANPGSSSSITGAITNAHVYSDAFCNLNNDIKILNVYSDESNAPTIGCVQKVEQLNYRSIKEPNQILDSLYNFEAGSFYMLNGVLLTEEDKFSREPVATSTTSSKTSSTTGSTSSNSRNEYDAVPKTGQNNAYLWLLGAAAACFISSGLLRKFSR